MVIVQEQHTDKTTEPQYIGVTDLPIEKMKDDNLQVSMYIEGLANFITSCHTPMTIALQGDWGTGKTSFMNLVIDQLKVESTGNKRYKHDQVETIVFNTWKYSQFNQEQNLSISFLSYVVSQLLNKKMTEILEMTSDKVLDEKKDGPVISFMKTIGRLTYGLTRDVTSQTLGSAMGVDVAAVQRMDGPTSSKDANSNEKNQFQRIHYVDSAAAIEELKQEFEKAVQYKLQETGVERIVIFIDDLDRLDPVVAVNLLEIIKLFLDVPKCVFVLSVDYGIVSKGVKLKNRDEKMDDEKAHSFFDKMIQVPFRIPMEFYNFENFLQSNLPDIKNFTDLSAVIRHSVGNNPRGVKRLLNSYYLISNIMSRGENNSDLTEQQVQLISLLCMQLAHEPLYKYFCADKKSLGMLKVIQEDELKALLNEEGISYSESNLRKHLLFIQALRKVIFGEKSIEAISENNDEDIEELEMFLTTLSYTNITSERVTEEVEDIVQISLSEIGKYSPQTYSVEKIQCEHYSFKTKSANGMAFELYEYIIPENEVYVSKLKDYKNLVAMQEANIDKRLILPFLKQLDKDVEAKKWIEQNVPQFSFKADEYKDNLSERVLPGAEYPIITNYTAVATIKNLYTILNYIGYPHIDNITVMLRKKKVTEK